MSTLTARTLTLGLILDGVGYLTCGLLQENYLLNNYFKPNNHFAPFFFVWHESLYAFSLYTCFLLVI